jgi:hypothetical protein
MSLQLAEASHARTNTHTHTYIYILPFKEKGRRAAVVAKATPHNQGSVQRFKFAGRLEFSVGEWVI